MYIKILCILFLVAITTKILYKYRQSSISENINTDNINILEVKNMVSFLNNIEEIPPEINIENIIPKHLSISSSKNKGWMLVSNKKIKKGGLISNAPIAFFSKKYNTKIISKIGEKYVYPHIHSGIEISNNDVFAYWDAFINHDINNNAYYSPYISIKNGRYFSSLFASKDIQPNEEITINYHILGLIYIKLVILLLIN